MLQPSAVGSAASAARGDMGPFDGSRSVSRSAARFAHRYERREEHWPRGAHPVAM